MTNTAPVVRRDHATVAELHARLVTAFRAFPAPCVRARWPALHVPWRCLSGSSTLEAEGKP